MALFSRRKSAASGPGSQPNSAFGSIVPAATEAVVAPGRTVFRRAPRRLRALIVIPLMAGFTGAAAVGAMLIYYTVTFPDPLSLRQQERAPVVRILARDGSVLAERGGAHDYMPLDLLPRLVTDAVVATEDRRFYEHWGLDPAGLARAVFANLRAGRFAQGGSTLTQQLAKNMFLSPDRTLVRKVEELVLALWLELRLSKNDILELYLNRVYFGGGAYGIEAAAQRYFDKSARELSIAEAAVIAGLLKAPSKYAPSASPEQALLRGRSVIAKMRDAGVITADEAAKASRQNVTFVEGRRTSEAMGHGYAIDYVLENLPPLVGAGHAEVVVETTLDPALQRRASEILQDALARNGVSLAASQGSIAVLDEDGGIRALVGGRSHAESQFNRAAKARRQPGSAFKPFVYLAALEAGYTPDSLAYDLPLSVGGWTPRNENGRYIGAVTLRQALAQSINSVAVRLSLYVGAPRVAAVARRLGITSELREEPSLALGTSEVSLLELAGAYGAFANGGRLIAPHAIRRVRMSSGRILYARAAPKSEQVIAPQHVAAMNDMLGATMSWGTGKRAALPTHQAAGKTGTSQEFRDAWFVGYTAHFTGGVWIGNDNGHAMNKVMGGQLPAEIWREVMIAAHAGKAPLALPGAGARPVPAPAASDQIAANGESELLPWLRRPPSGASLAEATATPAPATPAPATALRAPPPQMLTSAHPARGISADFIAHALEGGTLKPEDSRLAGTGTTAPTTTGRIIVRPPEGMMGLGSGTE